MESTYAGLIIFPRGIICKNEVLGKTFRTTIGEQLVGIQMPKVADGANNIHGKLESSTPGFNYDIDWGYDIRIPNKTNYVKAATLIFKGTEHDADAIYSAFPYWLDRVTTLVKMYPYDLFKEPKSQQLQMGDDGKPDKYTGLLLNQLTEDKWKYVSNPDNTIQVKLDPNYDNEGFSSIELSDVFINAGMQKPFSQSYYFLSEASGAYRREDNRACVIFASLALEYGIIVRVKDYCKENGIAFTPLGMLGKKFKKLKELGIEIPITDYQSRIIDFRNDVVHKGANVTDAEAVDFWRNCASLIYTYNSNWVLTEDDEDF